MTKSLIICWIANCDYPLFRLWLHKYYSWFDEIIIYWNISFRFPFFNAFIQFDLSDIPNIKFLDQAKMDFATQDWRNVATNKMLEYAIGDWIISIEQDFVCKDWDRLLNSCKVRIQTADLFGWWNPTNTPYIHPSFFFCKREIIEKAGRDFSPHPEVNGGDHFAAISWKAKELGALIVGLEIGEVNPKSLAFHIGGINNNYLDGINNGVFHRPEIFSVYNYFSKHAKVQQSVEFVKLMDKISEKLPYKEYSGWEEFF